MQDAAAESATLGDANPEKRPAAPIGRALCVAASDEADEIAASMLAQLLEEQGVSAVVFSPCAWSQALALLEPQPNDRICISAVPPFAFAPARILARQLRSKFPKTQILVCLWGFGADADKALQRFEPPRPERILSSLSDTVEYFKPTASSVKAA